jgi:TatD DNase family protein
MLVVGTDAASSREAVELAARHPEVVASVGLHPHEASRFEAEWPEIVDLADAPGVVAIGETGFDFHYDHSPHDAQGSAFAAHVELARRLDRPLVVHSRDAWDATFDVLAAARDCRFVLHCFTGGPAEASRALALGAWVSFSGIVSFRNADDVRAAAALVPPERLLVETDAPYLAPVPHRGRPNEPGFIADVGAALGAATGRTVAEIAGLTAANARTLLALPGI